MSTEIHIEDVGEEHAPPSMPLLSLSVVGKGLAVSIETCDENNKGSTYTRQAGQVIVPIATVWRALQTLAPAEAERREFHRDIHEGGKS